MSEYESEYRIVYHNAMRTHLESCLAALLAAGWNIEALTTTLESMEQQLKLDRLSRGDPLFHLRSVDLIIAVVCARPFVFHVGISEKARTVLVRHVSLLTLEQE